MDSPAASMALPGVLAVVMLGLGLSLTIDDFTRVRRHGRAVLVALSCQIVVLPMVCLGLVVALGVEPRFAVGMMLLAASPGGTAANLFSHLFRGDVALNIALTALNSVIAVVSLPVIADFAIRYFEFEFGRDVGFRYGKLIQVFLVVLVPVVVGIFVRTRRPDFAQAMDRPVRYVSALVLVILIGATAVAERAHIGAYLSQVGAWAVLFATCSLTIGYLAPRAAGVGRAQATACAMEIGIHNAALAIALAVSVLDSVQLAIPAAVYGVAVFPLAAAFGVIVSPMRQHQPGS